VSQAEPAAMPAVELAHGFGEFGQLSEIPKAAAMPATECANESLAAIRDLRRVAELVSESVDPAAAWFVARLAEYEDAAFRKMKFTFDEILGLQPRQGCSPWYEIEKLQQRNHWLCQAAQRHFAGCSVTKQSKQIAVELKRFEAGPEWRKAKRLAAPPDAWRSTERECWFRILKCGDAPEARTIRTILSH
jgi:hypothetical protein